MFTKAQLRQLGENVDTQITKLTYHIQATIDGILYYANKGELNYTEAIFIEDLDSGHIKKYIDAIKEEFPDIELTIIDCDHITHYEYSWD